MATALVQAKATNSASSPFTTAGITTTSGNALAISIAIYNGSGDTLSSFTDNRGNTFNLSPSSPNSLGASSIQIYVYTAFNITGGAGHTFTVTNSMGGDGGTIIVCECSGCNVGSGLLRGDAAYTQTGGHTSHAGATIAAGSGDIVLAFSSDDNRASDTFTAGLGLTIPSNGSITGAQPTGFVQYAANVAAGNVTGAYTTSAFASSTQIIVALTAPPTGLVEQMMMGMG